MKKRNIILLILVSLLILSLGCGVLGGDHEEDAQAAEEPAAAEPAEPESTPVPPTEPPPTEDAEPTPDTNIVYTQAAQTVEAQLTKIAAQTTPEPERPSWRMDAPEGAILVMHDSDNNADWEEIAASHAANLAIPAPFYYEVYLLPSGIKFPEVEAHYKSEMSARKYDIARNQQDTTHQIYLMTFLYSLNKTSKNAVMFYAELPNREPMVMVIYSNPIE
jgi:hypothetical protein